jgi:hypothetical protein
MDEENRLSHWDYSRIKSGDRIQVNNILVAVCVASLAILMSMADKVLNTSSILQLTLAIPCLVSSSLAYSKSAYREEKEFNTWNQAGWFLHTVGYLMIINSTALLIYVNEFVFSSWALISTTSILYLLFAILDIKLKKDRRNEKIFKLLFYLACVFLGFILPTIT